MPYGKQPRTPRREVDPSTAALGFAVLAVAAMLILAAAVVIAISVL